jgi:hypothetical protein
VPRSAIGSALRLLGAGATRLAPARCNPASRLLVGSRIQRSEEKKMSIAQARGFWSVLAVASALAGPAQSAPMDQDVFADFENLSLLPSEALLVYVHGTTPEQVTFIGHSGRRPTLSLYHSGIRAYWLEPGEVGLIEFETPASVVQFFARDVTPAGASSIEALDDMDAVVGSVDLTGSWLEYDFSGLGPILSLRVTNPGRATLTGIDDFGVSFVPEPWPHLLGCVALTGVALLAWRRRHLRTHVG